MVAKPKPNHHRYIEIIRRMTPAERLQKAWELTEMSRKMLKAGIRHRHPELTEEEIHKLYLQQLARCHNQNY